jgi:outer membrane protein OmpA-like peptidoglycan-associated protein
LARSITNDEKSIFFNRVNTLYSITALKTKLESLASETGDLHEEDILTIQELRADVQRLRDSLKILTDKLITRSENPLIVRNSYSGDCACTRIYYALAEHVANYSKYPELDSIAERLKNDPSLKLRIEGHADKRGNQQANTVLALKRANNLKAHFIRTYNIEEMRITTEGFGSNVQINEITDPYLYHLNRRVEVYLD